MINDAQKTTSMNLRTFTALALAAGTLCLLLYGYLYTGNRQENYNKQNIEAFLDAYEQVKETELSDDLFEELILIITQRQDCFATQYSYDQRSKTCKREYIKQIVQLARHHIRSAPYRGRFIRCVSECPIAGSLCNGEDDSPGTNCIETEARCIEYCLDTFWRGGNFPGADSFYGRKTD